MSVEITVSKPLGTRSYVHRPQAEMQEKKPFNYKIRTRGIRYSSQKCRNSGRLNHALPFVCDDFIPDVNTGDCSTFFQLCSISVFNLDSRTSPPARSTISSSYWAIAACCDVFPDATARTASTRCAASVIEWLRP